MVAGFSVNVAGLSGMSAQLLRAGDDAAAIRAHLGKIDSAAFSGLFLETVRGRFEEVLRAQVGDAITAQFAAQQVGNEIANSLDYYRDTDQAQMASFDARLPTSAEPDFMFSDQASDVLAASYTDVNDPRGRLTEPPGYDEEMSWKPRLVTDLGNVSEFVRGTIKFITGVDPIEPLEKLVAGNWAEVRGIADRFNNAAWAFADCADNIEHCANSSQADWSGNAGDGARFYLGRLATGYYGEYEKNEFLSGQIKDLADGVFETATALADTASDWINKRLLPALAEIGVAGATEEIPGWDLLADGVAGWNAYRAFQEGYDVYEKANAIDTMIEALGAALSVGQNGSLTMPDPVASLPAQTYWSPVSPKD
jgi:hypothetical protein